MLKNKLKNQMAKHEDGFTIIEVIIVLVIGAVIMLAVFLVVPQLQRTQRNTRRQADARRVLAAAEQFSANNNGTNPTCTGSLTTGTGATCTNITDITGQVNSPSSGSPYGITAGVIGTTSADLNNMGYTSTGTCTNNGTPTATGTNRVVTVQIENATSATLWCVSN